MENEIFDSGSARIALGCQGRFQHTVTMVLPNVLGPNPSPAYFWARDRHIKNVC